MCVYKEMFISYSDHFVKSFWYRSGVNNKTTYTLLQKVCNFRIINYCTALFIDYADLCIILFFDSYYLMSATFLSMLHTSRYNDMHVHVTLLSEKS